MNTVAVCVFWVSLAGLCFNYVGYPLLVCLVSRWRPMRRRRASELALEDLPDVTVLIAAHNAEQHIGRRIQNILDCDYPAGRLTIAVASDGSTDATVREVRRFDRAHIQAIPFRQRRGKVLTLADAVRQLRSEVVVFTDASSRFDRDALRQLARHFVDPQIGLVTGKVSIVDEHGLPSESVYWRSEMLVRRAEAQLGIMLGASGAIYAIRRRLFVEPPCPVINDDLVLPMLTHLRHGCDFVFDESARAYVVSSGGLAGEFRRRSRIGAGAFQCLPGLRELLQWRHARQALAFGAHKLLRWICPFLLVALDDHEPVAGLSVALSAVHVCTGCRISARTTRVGGSPARARDAGRTRRVLVSGNEPGTPDRFLSLGVRSPQCGLEPDAAAHPGSYVTCAEEPVAFMLRLRGMKLGTTARAIMTGWRRMPRPTHVFVCVADHFEPDVQGAPLGKQRERVSRWVNEYGPSVESFGDARGRPPQHTFFYPIETYRPEFLEDLAQLVRHGYGDVEVHLHHDDDNAARLRELLLASVERLHRQHGLLSTDATGRIRYGFIHGNWALDNSHPQGRWCGVNNELTVLHETGCYADFTMPAAPSPEQTRTINSIYYAVDDPDRPKSHDTGIPAAVGVAPVPHGLLMIQGPLLITLSRPWARPRLENGMLAALQPPTAQRLAAWLRAGVSVRGRPEWLFIKLYTHGAREDNMAVLLGPAMQQFHHALHDLAAQRGFEFYYVTAREMAQLVGQAQRGCSAPDFARLGWH